MRLLILVTRAIRKGPPCVALDAQLRGPLRWHRGRWCSTTHGARHAEDHRVLDLILEEVAQQHIPLWHALKLALACFSLL